MTRFLVTLFFGGLLISAACFGGVVALGGAEPLQSIVRHYAERADLDYGPFDDEGPTEPGSIVTREFPWAGGDDLSVSVPGEVSYTQGSTPKVTITGPANIVERIRVDEGEIDFVKGKGRRDWAKGIRIVVQAPAVTSFRFNGAQKVTLTNYAQDILRIEANGAVDLDAKGTARRIELRMNGAANADLEEVVNEEAMVELNGASNASVSPKTSVDIRINGVGNVSLGSKPTTINKEIHGLGTVSHTTGSSVSFSVGDDDEDKAPPITAPPAPPSAPSPPRGAASDT